MSWHLTAQHLVENDGVRCHITPQRAGWAYSGLTVYDLAAGPVEADLGPDEAVLVPLSAQDVQVRVDGRSFSLAGREGVFSAVSDWLYVPLGARLELHGDSGEVAVCTARASRRLPARHVPADQVAVEVRGAGRATRQVTNIATPDSFPDADRINVCEVITPGGNLSSWPPHRHDGLAGCPTSNEEIYYFRIGRTGPGGDSTPGHLHGHPDGQGLFHVYSVDGSVDETVTLHDGDVYLVPHGYHGPTVAPPEYPMYFLNVLAGPGPHRTMAFCDDPAHAWIRTGWADQEPDARLPMTAATGRVAR
ncbi:MAG: 5-deoxy-glucuronate isomerase [Kineosporiaceae bacterium]|nr:5-deoxy-glucuronate isomerase [Kineosporiaceae bacterium]MBK7621997.1 5-deoxy-glucuronate isomerase [Kineosporiaceae bacterium]